MKQLLEKVKKVTVRKSKERKRRKYDVILKFAP